MNFTATASFIWSVADLLRGDYKQSDYGKVILPFTLLRRLDCVLQETKPAVLAEYELRKGSTLPLDPILTRKAKQTRIFCTRRYRNSRQSIYIPIRSITPIWV